MPFKLTKDHIGKKVRNIAWPQDEHNWILLKWVEGYSCMGITKMGNHYTHERASLPEWEFYEEPKSQDSSPLSSGAIKVLEVWRQKNPTASFVLSNMVKGIVRDVDALGLFKDPEEQGEVFREEWKEFLKNMPTEPGVLSREYAKNFEAITKDFYGTSKDIPTPWWQEGKVYRSKTTGQLFKIHNLASGCCVSSYKENPQDDYWQCSSFQKKDFLKWKEDFEEYVPEGTFEDTTGEPPILKSDFQMEIESAQDSIHSRPGWMNQARGRHGIIPKNDSLLKLKTIRMAPALYKNKIDNVFWVSGTLFKNEAHAKDKFTMDTFIQWPASENLWVDVPVEDPK